MSHMPEAAYASAAAAAAPDTYATSRQHRASGGAPTTNGQHDGSANGASANDFRNAYSQDGFGGGGGSGGGAGGAGHWSQPSPYGSAYPANQFAAQNGSSHPSYPSSTASPYGASSMGGHQMHAAPYSAFSMQGQHGGAGGHHRGPAGHSMHINSQAYHHDSGPATPNGAGGLSQHATPGAGGLSGSPAYHSPSIAGMVPGVAHHHGAGAHQGYPSHYSQSMMGQPAAALQAGVSTEWANREDAFISMADTDNARHTFTSPPLPAPPGHQLARIPVCATVQHAAATGRPPPRYDDALGGRGHAVLPG